MRPIITVEHLSKQYRLGRRSSYRTFRETFGDAVQARWDRLRSGLRAADDDGPQRSNDSIWALRDISFDVKPGEVIGVVGRNGAGKSTLLKILSRVTEPTGGEAQIYGHLKSLLEVGTGFHPELTGRENIYLNGAILEMKRAEINRKFDEIVAFAEIEKFIDTPVKRYSSGMYVRLAFAVAAHLEPEILLVDEVLAVGDIAFQKKCLGKMDDTAHKEGRTILFVSHNMQAVRALCPRSILIDDGKIIADGPTTTTLARYYEILQKLEVREDTGVGNPLNRRGSGAARFTKIRIENESGAECFDFKMGGSIRFVLSYQTFARLENLAVAIVLSSGKTGEPVTSIRHTLSRASVPDGYNDSVVVEFPEATLRPGEYVLYFWLGNRLGQAFDTVDNLTCPLNIYTDKSFDELGFDPSTSSGYFNIESRVLNCIQK